MHLDRLIYVFFFLCLAGGALIAHFTGAPLLRGILIGVAVGISPFIILAVAAGLIAIGVKDRPRCRCGKGRSDDYRYIGPERFTADSVFEFECPFCRRRYGSKDGRFWEISKDGAVIPYMVLSTWGRWKADGGKPDVGARAVAPGPGELQQNGLSVAVRERKGIVALDVTAGPDVLDWQIFEHRLDEMLNGGRKSIIVHLGNVTRIYALGVAALAHASDRARAKGAIIKLSNPSNVVRQALELTGVAASFEIYEDEDKAAASFEKNGPGDESGRR